VKQRSSFVIVASAGKPW